MPLYLIFILFSISNVHLVHCQKNKYAIRVIGFYNVENLFDTIDDPETIDEDYTPSGKNHYSGGDYAWKLKNTARVISEIGSTINHSGPVLMGLAEIENLRVLNDLVQTEELSKEQYSIIHKDSPDRRGIDVALLYQSKFFLPIDIESIELRLWNEKGERIYTRDILYVMGILDDEKIHVFVNHWPSRRGGKRKSDPKRMKAAYLLRSKITEILTEEPNAKIFIVGDFNDDPMDDSIKTGLLSHKDSITGLNHLYNPMENMFKKGLNTLAYRDGLNLFDQIIISSNLLNENTTRLEYQLYKAGIYNPAYLISNDGIYKGYPLRSFQNNRYAGGYSDHFPVFIELIKLFPQ